MPTHLLPPVADRCFSEVALEEAFASLVRDSAGQNFCLDFDAVELLSAAELGRLVALHRAAHERGGELILVNVRPLLLDEFEATGLARVLVVHPQR